MSIIRYRSDEPIMEADKPWEEGSFIRPVSVIPEPDGSRLRLYYLLWHRPDFAKNLLCMAYSTDAFNWEKPEQILAAADGVLRVPDIKKHDFRVLVIEK